MPSCLPCQPPRAQGSALGRRWGWEGGDAAGATAAVQLGLARPHEGCCVPPLVSRRVLEVLCYLCRHQSKVAGQLVGLGVPPLEELARRLAAQHDVKGESWARQCSGAEGCAC